MLKREDINKDEFLEYAKKHTDEMEKIILRYDNLQTPKQFIPSVDLFKLSAETQLESEKYTIEWIKTGDDTAYVRSDSLWQQAVQYEQAALLEFNLVQRQANP